MATVTKPIALDESLHTTEQTPRNLADVLAQALQMLNTTISGLNFINCVVVQALPTTDISTTTIYLVPKNPSQTDNLYDEYINLTGTSAGWEKIGDTKIDLSGYYTSAEVDDLLADKADVSDIPTVNDGTLTIQQNGETKGTFTANQSGNSTVNIETPTTDIQTAVDEFETYNGGLLSECKVALEPIQDLHGYPEPWVGGAGKNKLPTPYYHELPKTINNTTFSDNGDGGIKIKTSGATTANCDFILSNSFSMSEESILSGCPEGGSGSTYALNASGGYSDRGSGVTLPSSYSGQIYIRVYSGATVDDVVVYPMIRLSTESDPTFAPYSNICPITGHTEVKVGDDGKNKLPNTVASITKDGVTFTVHSDGTVMLNGTSTNVTSAAYEIIALNGTYILNGCPSGGGSGTYELQAVTTITSRDYGDGVTFTVNGDCLVQILVRQGVTLNNVVFKPMIRLASDTDPTFVPYNGYQVTVNLGGTYYSGTLDVVSGVFTPDTADVDLGTLTWSLTAQGYMNGTGIGSLVKKPASSSNVANIICSALKTVSAFNIYSGGEGIGIHISGEVRVRYDGMSTDVPTFTSAMSGVQLVYELATPTPIQLSPTMVKALVGENHLSAPLEGQEITESKYKQMFTFDDVIAYIQSLS